MWDAVCVVSVIFKHYWQHFPFSDMGRLSTKWLFKMVLVKNPGLVLSAVEIIKQPDFTFMVLCAGCFMIMLCSKFRVHFCKCLCLLYNKSHVCRGSHKKPAGRRIAFKPGVACQSSDTVFFWSPTPSRDTFEKEKRLEHFVGFCNAARSVNRSVSVACCP